MNNKNNKHNRDFIFSVVALIIVAIGAFYFYSFNQITEQKTINNDQQQEDDKDYPENWSRYAIEELGFSFAYPPEWGDVQPEERQGFSDGTKITIEFSNYKDLVIGGISSDFEEGREGVVTDTQGFDKENGNYFFKFVNTRKESIDPLKVINTDMGEVVITNNESFVGSEEIIGPALTVGRDNLGAIVNLEDDIYSGVMFWNLNTNEFTLEKFEQMLRSIERI